MRVQRANDNVRVVLHSDTGGRAAKGVLKFFRQVCEFVCMKRIAPKDMLNGASNLTKTMISGG